MFLKCSLHLNPNYLEIFQSIKKSVCKYLDLLEVDHEKLNINCMIAPGFISTPMTDKLTDEQKIDLIFSPNLSTKEQVSEISGRGIGMDIVKKNIERMGGKINIKTDFGQSTEFEIIIPN